MNHALELRVDRCLCARLTLAMSIFRLFGLSLAMTLTNGCGVFHHQKTEPAQPTPARAPAAAPSAALNPIITPDNSLTARVAAYNSAGRFVVLTFPVGLMPAKDQTLFLYRNGLKTGEVKITGPQRDNDVVADLVAGTAQVGDEVHEQ